MLSLFRATPLRFAASRKTSSRAAATTTAAVRPANGVVGPRGSYSKGGEASLAAAHPLVAALWKPGGKNFLVRPNSCLSNAVKAAEWRCLSCNHEYMRRIRDQVSLGGQCPSCGAKPTEAQVAKLMAETDASQLEPANRTIDGAKIKTGRKRRNAKISSWLEADAAVNADEAAAESSGSRCSALELGRSVDPMLAQGWETWRDQIPDEETLYISPKLDGIRCIVAYDQKGKTPVFLSRKGKVFESCDHLVPALKPLFAADPTLVLDGELYNHDLLANEFEALVGAVRTTKKHATDADRQLQRRLQFHAFDVMHSKLLIPGVGNRFGDVLYHGNQKASATKAVLCRGSGFNAPYWKRLQVLRKSIVPQAIRNHAAARKSIKATELSTSKLAPVVAVPAVQMTKDEIDVALKKAINDSYEGIMIRRRDGSYGFGKRSPYLLKHKKMHDAEYVIVELAEGKGKFSGGVGAIVCQTKEGRRFTASPSVTEAMRKEMLKKRSKYVGKMLTVQFQGLSNGGVPRFPIGKCVRGAPDGSDWI